MSEPRLPAPEPQRTATSELVISGGLLFGVAAGWFVFQAHYVEPKLDLFKALAVDLPAPTVLALALHRTECQAGVGALVAFVLVLGFIRRKAWAAWLLTGGLCVVMMLSFASIELTAQKILEALRRAHPQWIENLKRDLEEEQPSRPAEKTSAAPAP
ncbi:MAG: hypothetical protein M5U26_30650 [Planctomycetota bacterium]|nr:hypothetical protein [Planctomycetota bacterium]